MPNHAPGKNLPGVTQPVFTPLFKTTTTLSCYKMDTHPVLDKNREHTENKETQGSPTTPAALTLGQCQPGALLSAAHLILDGENYVSATSHISVCASF